MIYIPLSTMRNYSKMFIDWLAKNTDFAIITFLLVGLEETPRPRNRIHVQKSTEIYVASKFESTDAANFILENDGKCDLIEARFFRVENGSIRCIAEIQDFDKILIPKDEAELWMVRVGEEVSNAPSNIPYLS